MNKIRVFETFAGIGAQHKAISILKEYLKNDYQFEIAGTSEWDIWANISYNAIHHNNKNIAKNLSEDELDEFLLKFEHSRDSKKPMSPKNVIGLQRNVKELLYSSIVNSKNQGSITKIKGEDLIKNIDEFQMLTYSFPCQDLSVAGSFHGFNQGMAKGSNTRSGLLWEIERLLIELDDIKKLPKYLLLENVKNMISKRHRKDYEEWLEFLSSLGYKTQTYVLNSLEYGVPQSRERVYALSVRDADDGVFHDTFKKNGYITEKNKPKDISSEINISRKLNELLHIDYDNVNDKNEALKAIPNRTVSRKRMYDDNRLLFTLRKTKKNSREQQAKYKYYEVDNKYYLTHCSTITTKQDRHPNAGNIDLKSTKLGGGKKARYRFITPREAYLLMGFHEADVDKIFQNDFLKKEVLYRQAGNSIVVNVLVAIFNKIIKKRGDSKND
ncbi:DNA (cytosine-5-)-methyltransferase [Spiroplasma apis]|uniref:DNA (cytosine-5-)-methyltransferase n=1 Tax=Spiroplasma apis B31 TaxID=1276258 RepID=V5RKA6_SPIAP|nr:DNA (cytosine-5-)-methyltransferase [Spiroplasma apis]AHB36526.1 DNA-methyltransferase [Spiroplasma apis B31]